MTEEKAIDLKTTTTTEPSQNEQQEQQQQPHELTGKEQRQKDLLEKEQQIKEHQQERAKKRAEQRAEAVKRGGGSDKRIERYKKAFEQLKKKGQGAVTINMVRLFLANMLTGEAAASLKKKQKVDPNAVIDPNDIQPNLDDVIADANVSNPMTLTIDEFIRLIKGIKLEKRTITAAKVTFAEMDANDSNGSGNGSVTTEDAAHHLAHMAVSYNGSSTTAEEKEEAHARALVEIQAYVDSFDGDASGTLSFPEFWELSRGQRNLGKEKKAEIELEKLNEINKLPTPNSQSIRRRFNHYDTDRDGAIDERELHAWMLSVNDSVPTPTLNVAEAIVAGHDGNDDGVMDLEEIKAWIHEGSMLAASERELFGQQSDIFRECVEFLEAVVSLNDEQFKEKFQQYDIDQDGGLTPQELLPWLIDEVSHQKSTKDSTPSLVDARSIIAAHDDNGDGVLQYEELEKWFNDGAKVSYTDRRNLEAQGGTFRQSILFMEQSVRDSTKEEQEALPEVNDDNVKSMFSQYDVNADGSLDAEELLAWMIDEAKRTGVEFSTDVVVTVDSSGDCSETDGKSRETNGLDEQASKKKHERLERNQLMESFGAPTLELCQEIIRQHDNDANGVLDYNELRGWLMQGSTLTKKERRALRIKSSMLYHSVTFLEQVARETALHGDIDADNDDEGYEGYEINVANLRKTFDSYDQANDGSINAQDLFDWMQDAEAASKMVEEAKLLLDEKLGSQREKTKKWSIAGNIPPTLLDAGNIVQAHDTDGNGLLEYDELLEWIKSGATLPSSDRNTLRRRGRVFKHSVDFMERVVQHSDNWSLPPVEEKENQNENQDQDQDQDEKKIEATNTTTESSLATETKQTKKKKSKKSRKSKKKQSKAQQENKKKEGPEFMKMNRTKTAAYARVMEQAIPSYHVQLCEGIAIADFNLDGKLKGGLSFKAGAQILICGSCDVEGDCMLESLYPQTNSEWWYGTTNAKTDLGTGHFPQEAVKVTRIPIDDKSNAQVAELQRQKLYAAPTEGEDTGFSRNRGGGSNEEDMSVSAETTETTDTTETEKVSSLNRTKSEEENLREKIEKEEENLQDLSRVVKDGIYLGMITAPKMKLQMKTNNGQEKVILEIHALVGNDTFLTDATERVKYHLKEAGIELKKVEKIKKMLLKYSIKKGYQQGGNGNSTSVSSAGKRQKRRPRETNNVPAPSSPDAKQGRVRPPAQGSSGRSKEEKLLQKKERKIQKKREKEKQRIQKKLERKEQEDQAIAAAAVKAATGIDHIALNAIISLYDKKNKNGSLIIEEVYQWMSDARDAYGSESGKPTLADAAMLVHAFDVDNSETLDESELAAWLSEGVQLTHEERMKMATTSEVAMKQGASHPRVMEFMSNVLTSLDTAVLSTSDCPPVGKDEIVAVLVHDQDESRYGGITINAAMCVSNMKENSVAYNAGVRIGDRIIRVGADNLISGINGESFSKNWSKLIAMSGRPLEMRFRRDNGLPPLSRIVLRSMFDTYDVDQSGALDADELRQWMLDLSVNADINESPSTMSMDNLGPPTQNAARVLISAHDDDGDNVLNYAELEHWVAGGSRLLPRQRRRYAGRGDNFAHAVRFLEHVIVDSAKEETQTEMKERHDMKIKSLSLNSSSSNEDARTRSKLLDRNDISSNLKSGEYLWDITNDVLGFVLNEYHEIVDIVEPSSAASMGDVGIGDCLIRVGDQETLTWAPDVLKKTLSCSENYPIHVVFQKVDQDKSPRRNNKGLVTKTEGVSQNINLAKHSQPTRSLHDIALETPLEKVWLDADTRENLGYLPRLHRKNLKANFDEYQQGATNGGDGKNALDAPSLLKWMQDAREEAQEADAWLTRSSKDGSGFSDDTAADDDDQLTIEITNKIISTHDENGDSLLEWKEFVTWITEGARLTKDDRDLLAERSPLFRHTVRFMEVVVRNSSVGAEDDGWLPYLSSKNLQILFQRHDLDDNGSVDKHEMLEWMMQIMMNQEANAALHPTLELAELIIRAHDDDDNGRLEYLELETWIKEGLTSSPDDLNKYRQEGTNENLMVQFLEKICQAATYEAISPEEEQEVDTAILNYQRQQRPENAAEVEEPAKPVEYLRGTFEDGPLGIQFNHECEVLQIKRDSQGCKFVGLSKGDLLVEVGDTSVRGKTFRALMAILQNKERPVEVVFERHRAWERKESTGLPHVDWKQLQELFAIHEIPIENGGGVECAEFAAFMSEIHQMAMGKQGREPINHCDMASIILAQRLIDAHDNNDDSRLEWVELKNWLISGLSMSKPERHAYAARGGYCPDSVRFLEDVAHGCHVSQEAEAQLIIEEMQEVENEVTFIIDLSKPFAMAITHPTDDYSHYPAVITSTSKGGQADAAGVQEGMHIHYINDESCRDHDLQWVMDLIRNAKNDANTKTMKMVCAFELPPMKKEKEIEAKTKTKTETETKTISETDTVNNNSDSERKKNGDKGITKNSNNVSTSDTSAAKATIKKPGMKDLHTLTINEAVLRKMFDAYDIDDVGTFTGKELLRWINESAQLRTKVLHLPKLSLDKSVSEIDAQRKREVLNQTEEERREEKKTNLELGTRVLWALAWGLHSDESQIEDAGLAAMGNNLSFRKFMKWVRKVVNLGANDRQLVIAAAVAHHIGGQFVEDSDRLAAELQKKREVATFLGLSFIDTIVRLACRGPVVNGLPEVNYEGMRRIFEMYGRVQQNSKGDQTKLLKIQHLMQMTDDLIVTSLYMTVEGGKYKAKKSSYGQKGSLDPIKDTDDAREMLEMMGGTSYVSGYEGVAGDEGLNDTALSFEQLEKWIMVNCLRSYFERYQVASRSILGAHLMLFLERLVIAASCDWDTAGFTGEDDWTPTVKTIEALEPKVIRDKECSTEVAFWRHDPRLESIKVDEIPVPSLTYSEGKGCGIRMDMDMRITAIRPNR